MPPDTRSQAFRHHVKDIHPDSIVRQCSDDSYIVETDPSKDLFLLAEDCGLGQVTLLEPDPKTFLFEPTT